MKIQNKLLMTVFSVGLMLTNITFAAPVTVTPGTKPPSVTPNPVVQPPSTITHPHAPKVNPQPRA